MHTNDLLDLHLVCDKEMIPAMEGRATLLHDVILFLMNYYEITDEKLRVVYSSVEAADDAGFATELVDGSPSCGHFCLTGEDRMPTIFMLHRPILLHTFAFIAAICHEFIHFIQTADGRYVESKDSLYFHGEKYGHDTLNYSLDKDGGLHDDLPPWETEAYDIMETLANEYVDHINKQS